MDAKPQHAKHVYFDVVGFTNSRTIEAQAEIIEALNGAVEKSLHELGIVRGDNLLLLPSGDGMCITLLGSAYDQDVHVKLALALLRNVEAYNRQQSLEAEQRFSIRIGVNENVDNVVKDVNGNRNVAGEGINIAHRAMTIGDAGNIFVGPTVFLQLRGRRDYMGKFQEFVVAVKHSDEMQLYQYIDARHKELATSIPVELQEEDSVDPEQELRNFFKEDRRALFYCLACHKHQHDLRSAIKNDQDYVIRSLLWAYAEDYFSLSSLDKYTSPTLRLKRRSSFSEHLSRYLQLRGIDMWPLHMLSGMITDRLAPVSNRFEYSLGAALLFPSEELKLFIKNHFTKEFNFVFSATDIG